MIFMNKQFGYLMVLLTANHTFFAFETEDLEYAKFTAVPDVDAMDLLHRDFEFIGEL